ncbi:MAG: peptidase, partial [Segetibacter sp.]|nr:peptidase [Segetibacter sp.]
MNRVIRTNFCVFATVFATITTGWGQQSNNRNLPAADYERAEKMMGYNTSQLADNMNVRANWLQGDRFWYRTLNAQGGQFMLVNPARGTKSPAFDQQKLATALSAATGKTYESNRLPFSTFSYSPDEKSILFSADKKRWNYNLETSVVTAGESATPNTAMPQRSSNTHMSPDGKLAAFIRNYNLWVRNVATNKETQLTTDGIKDFGYATDNAGWKKSDNPILAWSPDSKKIATYQQDQRNASDMYLVTTNVGKPTLQAWKYPLPGDKDIVT